MLSAHLLASNNESVALICKCDFFACFSCLQVRPYFLCKDVIKKKK